jgi:hypothetical protein
VGKVEESKIASTSINNVMRHEYRVLSEDEKALMLLIKDQGLLMLNTLFKIADSKPQSGRETAIATTKLEEVVMWACKALTK